jgi:hypothetical protein
MLAFCVVSFVGYLLKALHTGSYPYDVHCVFAGCFESAWVTVVVGPVVVDDEVCQLSRGVVVDGDGWARVSHTYET